MENSIEYDKYDAHIHEYNEHTGFPEVTHSRATDFNPLNSIEKKKKKKMPKEYTKERKNEF